MKSTHGVHTKNGLKQVAVLLSQFVFAPTFHLTFVEDKHHVCTKV